MGKLRIGRLLVISFGAIVLILVALGILGTARLNQSGAALKDITLKQEVKVSLTNHIRLTATSVLLEVENIVLAPTTTQSDAATARLNADSADILAAYDKLKAIGLDDTETKYFNEALALRQRFRDSFTRALQMLSDGSRESAVPLLFDETLPALQTYREKLQSIIDYQEKNTAASRDAAIAGASSAKDWMIRSTALGAVLDDRQYGSRRCTGGAGLLSGAALRDDADQRGAGTDARRRAGRPHRPEPLRPRVRQ